MSTRRRKKDVRAGNRIGRQRETRQNQASMSAYQRQQTRYSRRAVLPARAEVAEVPGISPRAYHVGCSVKAADYNSSLIHHVRHPMTAFCRAFLAFLILRFGFLRRWRKAVPTSPPQPNTTRIRPRAYTALSPLSDMQTPKRTVSVTLRSVMPRSRQRLTAWKE